VVEQYANNPIEADHGRLKAWTRLNRPGSDGGSTLEWRI
jgi:hypothetical protein